MAAVHGTVAGFGEQLERRLERCLLGEPLVGDDLEPEQRAERLEAVCMQRTEGLEYSPVTRSRRRRSVMAAACCRPLAESGRWRSSPSHLSRLPALA